MTRIELRPIGSPMPLGFFTVATGSALISALQWGILPPSGDQAIALIIFSAFVIQVIVSVFAFLGRGSIAATLVLSFVTTWPADAPVFYLHSPGTAEALGIFLLVFTVFAAVMLASVLPKRSPATFLAVAVPRLLAGGLTEITGSLPAAQAAASHLRAKHHRLAERPHMYGPQRGFAEHGLAPD